MWYDYINLKYALSVAILIMQWNKLCVVKCESEEEENEHNMRNGQMNYLSVGE